MRIILRSLYERNHVKKTVVNTFHEYLPLRNFRMRATPSNLPWHLSVQEPLMHCLPHYLIGEVHMIYEVRLVFFDSHSREKLKQDL